jgi:predicted TIM-barrel fold metal-dependent hydrolase
MRLDCHVHINEGAADPARLRREMNAAGCSGACIISLPPRLWRHNRLVAVPAAERLDNLRAWTAGQSGLHPLFWIDPTDPDALRQVDQAVAAGVAGFKVICSAHAPGDPRAMPVYRAIAGHNRPILFHSGILWDGCASSEFNRPAAFEPLLEVPRLRFALAHMSWPWLDECIAVYGKFLNATAVRADAPEMFVDLTPGTPPIYRAEALTKLFTVGYDVAGNVLFGTDTNTESYNVKWSREWQERDQAILLNLGVGPENLARYFGGNLQRWLAGAQSNRRPVVPGQDA